MSRPLSRVVMTCMGIAVFFVYAVAASLSAFVLYWLVADPPSFGVLLVGFLIAVLVGGYGAYRLGTLRLITDLDTAPLSRAYAPGVYRLLSRLCHRMAIREPSLLVADLGAPNALSLGGPRSGAVVLDRHLFALLAADELEAILAHELAHMEQYDTFLKTLLVTAARLLVALISVLLIPVVLLLAGIDRAVAWIAGQPRAQWVGLTSLFQAAVAIIIGVIFFPLTLLLLAYSRRQEYAADRRAAEVTGRPIALARALAKIHRASTPNRGLLSLLYIHEQEHRPPPWLSTHPPVDRRIERLLAHSQRDVGHQRLDRLR